MSVKRFIAGDEEIGELVCTPAFLPPASNLYVLAEDYDALLAERDALAKDAARYRWLKNGNDSAVLDDMACEIADYVSGHLWDEKIDAAMLPAPPDAGDKS